VPTACASTSLNQPDESRPAAPPPGRLSAADIPSYLIRRGRTGVTSREALERLWPVYGVSALTDLPRVTVVEVGFGMGEATALMAAAAPAVEVLAIEVHPAGIAALLRRLEAASLSNVHVWEGNAVPVLEALPDHSLDQVRLWFPDPWPKARHAKRRLLRPAFATLLGMKLSAEGFLHLATDWPAYIEHAHEALPGWSLEQVTADRPLTGYEKRAHHDGRTAVDLICRPPRP
jgi:tRNA (guanine-N7-)-methyltransferase